MDPVAAPADGGLDPLGAAPGQQFPADPVSAALGLADAGGQPFGELAAVLGAALPEPEVAADLRPVVLGRVPGPLIETKVGGGDAGLPGDELHRVAGQLRPPRAGTGRRLRRTSAAARTPAGSARASRRPAPAHRRAASSAGPARPGPSAPPRLRDPRPALAGGTDKEVPVMAGGGTLALPGTRQSWTHAGGHAPGTGEVPLPPAERTSRFLLPEGTGCPTRG